MRRKSKRPQESDISEWILQSRWSKSEPRAPGPMLRTSLNSKPEKPNSPASYFWEEIYSLIRRLLGKMPQTTVMDFAVIRADPVRPSWSKYDCVPGDSVVSTDGSNQETRDRGEHWGLCFQHLLYAICYDYRYIAYNQLQGSPVPCSGLWLQLLEYPY